MFAQLPLTYSSWRTWFFLPYSYSSYLQATNQEILELNKAFFKAGCVFDNNEIWETLKNSPDINLDELNKLNLLWEEEDSLIKLDNSQIISLLENNIVSLQQKYYGLINLLQPEFIQRLLFVAKQDKDQIILNLNPEKNDFLNSLLTFNQYHMSFGASFTGEESLILQITRNLKSLSMLQDKLLNYLGDSIHQYDENDLKDNLHVFNEKLKEIVPIQLLPKLDHESEKMTASLRLKAYRISKALNHDLTPALEVLSDEIKTKEKERPAPFYTLSKSGWFDNPLTSKNSMRLPVIAISAIAAVSGFNQLMWIIPIIFGIRTILRAIKAAEFWKWNELNWKLDRVKLSLENQIEPTFINELGFKFAQIVNALSEKQTQLIEIKNQCLNVPHLMTEKLETLGAMLNVRVESLFKCINEVATANPDYMYKKVDHYRELLEKLIKNSNDSIPLSTELFSNLKNHFELKEKQTIENVIEKAKAPENSMYNLWGYSPFSRKVAPVNQVELSSDLELGKSSPTNK